ncbi:diguanylate cyclase (GGDEF)-like protein [Rhodoblastus acidophilus]|uniref:putative bifunctional diguanylate cyclase/phosphodiesterase n=1 Tax=Rhodoblastus acidophilus TaxID=1074 RepID=UPI0022243134|nr:bifunctional diguanylate cyclase/phosphodiesterase [Rhodoblastus acidophilus]MCW2284279.1 diguanylate cyclase (GGDEF)-like protein [Rhodoblastus acidophilus]MCW2334710.1 diguanylate cyclase (GGDEF)-like protein [Rhodoblastus acidophilus]
MPSQPPLAPPPRPILPLAPPLREASRTGDSAPFSTLTEAPDPRRILDSLGEVVYDWDLRSDQINWGPNVAAVLGVANLASISTGRAFAERLSHESESSRYEAIARSSGTDCGKGVPFQICYGLVPHETRAATIWIEDTGRWFAGSDGRPARAHGLVRIITERYKQERQLAFTSRFDTLTGVLNRASLLEQAPLFFAQAAKKKQSFAALLAAIDNVFVLNRSYGYDIADQVIAGIAQRLRINCRERDIVARYAGNKFALLLENCDAEELTAAAERLIDMIGDQPFETAAGPVAAKLRVGAVVAPRNGRAAHLLFQNAEEALDLARQPGGARLVIYEPSLMREDSRAKALKVSDEIVSALNDGRIVLALQPLIDTRTGAPALYEALMRLRQKDGALVSPSSILPTAEKSELIQRVDHRILELALKRLAEDRTLHLSVNMSGRTVRDAGFIAHLRASLGAFPELAKRLMVEFTETCAIEDIDATVRAVDEIKTFGARVAMDDFGAGHTSFKNLRRFNFDLVKIDGAFVQNLSRSADDRFFVKTLVELARHVGLPVVAEWVEDAETARILTDWGVDYLQGDFFAAAAVPEAAAQV